jgi:CheY-like chemotaxis protein
MTAAKVRLAQAVMGKPENIVGVKCKELIIATSGIPGDDQRSSVGAAEADFFLQKPFSSTQLLHAINQLLTPHCTSVS